MKNVLLICLISFFSQSFAQTVKADDILGTWLTGSGKAKVQIYKSGNKYNGKIVWLKNPTYDDGKPKVDKNNKDKAKQSTPLMGLNLLKDFEFDDDEWEDGTIYDPEDGKTYSCNIKMRNGSLDVRGYVGLSLLGRTQIWIKVADVK